MAEGTSDERPYYGLARQIAGLVLFFGAVILLLIDAFNTDYTVDSIVLGLMFGTGAILLGADTAAKRVFPRGDDD